MNVSVPKSLARLAMEIEGWLELGAPDQALARLRPLLESTGAREAGLFFRAKALVGLDRFGEALDCIGELRPFHRDPEWLDLTEAWCLKRTGQVAGAADCMERLLRRCHRSAIGHYNLGCYLALLGKTDRAIDEVSLACGMEAEFREHARTEEDLASLRADERFRRLLGNG
ncbi:MAG: hypothetical protein AAF628_24635 [Planctomycetota bacterium]